MGSLSRRIFYPPTKVWLGGGWWDGVGWDNNVICTSTHIIHLYALLHFIHIHTYVMLRFCKFFCTSTHTPCYAAGSLALPHIRHATLWVLLHFYTCVILRSCMFSPYDDDNNDDNDNNNDDYVDVADGTKVSFLSLFHSPLENV